MSKHRHHDYSEDMFADTRMTFGEHLEELRVHLIRALYGFGIALFFSLIFLGKPMLKIISEPAGTRGYDDLRRDASREPLGKGLRPSVASMGDHARMLAALNREQDLETLRRVRRLIELDRARSRGWSLER